MMNVTFTMANGTFFSGGYYIFDCETVFGSDDHEVKSCPAVKNVISITEKHNIHHRKT